MPKRVVKRRVYEVELERQPLHPAFERRVRKMAIDRSAAAMGEWDDAGEPIDRFYAGPSAVMAAFDSGQHERCREIAAQCLALAGDYQDNWNHGNAIHFAHTALGLVDAAAGDVSAAVGHLHRSGDVAGSPQLNSFGPSIMLARELLRHGQHAAVLTYFEQCRKFWKMGTASLDIWQKKVARGATPTFAMQLYR